MKKPDKIPRRKNKWQRGWHVAIKGYDTQGAPCEVAGVIMARPCAGDIYTVNVSGHGVIKVRAGAIINRITEAV